MNSHRLRSSIPIRLLCLAVSVVLLAGCIRTDIRVRVNGDGSGTIAVSRVLSREAAEMYDKQMKEMADQMKELTARMAEGGSDMPEEMQRPQAPPDPFFNTNALKRGAGQFGPGVKFVKAKPYDKDGARGSVTLYEFKNVNDIFINLEELMSGDVMGGSLTYGGGDTDEAEIEIADKGDDAFEFSLERGPTNTLKILCPDFAAVAPLTPGEPAPGGDAGEMEPMISAGELKEMTGGSNPFGLTGNETQEQVMARVCKGMKICIDVEVNGSNVVSNASRPSGKTRQRYVLLEADMGRVVETPGASRNLARFQTSVDSDSPAAFFSAIRAMPGVTVETNREVIIRFE